MKQSNRARKKSKDLSTDAIFAILHEHADDLRKYSVKKIGLFGSFARGEQKRRSDIDFMVELEQPTLDNFMDLIFSLQKYFGRNVDVITEGSMSPYILPSVEKEIKWYEV